MATPHPTASPTLTTQEIVASSAIPSSFDGDKVLFGVNMFLHSAGFLCGVFVLGWMILSIVQHRKVDRWPDPAMLFRTILACASTALAIRSGGQAATLWGWDPQSARTAAIVLQWTRLLDPVALCFAGAWLTLAVLSYPAMIAQLRKSPYPVQMLARLPDLKRPAAAVAMTFVASALIAWLK